MVASWSISEEKYPQKNQGTAGLEPATFSFNCHLQARQTHVGSTTPILTPILTQDFQFFEEKFRIKLKTQFCIRRKKLSVCR
jgi:hypothetical protein